MEIDITIEETDFTVTLDESNNLEITEIWGYLRNHRGSYSYVDCFDMAHHVGFIDQIEKEALEVYHNTDFSEIDN